MPGLRLGPGLGLGCSAKLHPWIGQGEVVHLQAPIRTSTGGQIQGRAQGRAQGHSAESDQC